MAGRGREHEGLPARPPASCSPRRAGALDISSCPQSRKDALYTKAREAFGSAGNTANYYRLMRPYLGEPLPCVRAPWPQRPPPLPSHCCLPPGGAPVEELRYLVQANVSMDIDTFTNLNPRVLQVGPRGGLSGVGDGAAKSGEASVTACRPHAPQSQRYTDSVNPRSLLPGLTPVLAPQLSTALPGLPLAPKPAAAGPSGPAPTALSFPLQSLSVGNVTTLLGQNVGDLQKARSHPTISSWLCSLNTSVLGELGLDRDTAGPTSLALSTTGAPNTTPWAPHLAPTSGQPGNKAPTSGMPQTHPPL